MKHIVNIFALVLVFAFSGFGNVYAEGTTKTVFLSVEGMTSNACPVILRSAVKHLDGVKRVDASLEGHSANVEFDEKLVSIEKIQETIEYQAGFTTYVKLIQ